MKSSFEARLAAARMKLTVIDEEIARRRIKSDDSNPVLASVLQKRARLAAEIASLERNAFKAA